MRRLLLLSCLLALVPATALAAGGPVPPVQGGVGVSLPGGPVRFVAVGVRGGTVVERIRTRDGALERTRFIARALGVPGVAYDGSTTGLSADGRTLVLVAVGRDYPPKRTTLVGFDTRRLRIRWRHTLPGFSMVDAVSADGASVYLLHYPSANDPLRYQVRVFDVATRRLLPDPVVDPREPDEKMTGTAVTRAVSADGRWAYTLYLKQDGTGFVHALDTAGRTAACIDLPNIAPDVASAHLRLDGGGRTLLVESSAGPQAVVDTTTFAVRHPDAGRPDPAPAPAPEPPAEGDSPWVLLLLPLAALAALPALRRRRHRLGS